MKTKLIKKLQSQVESIYFPKYDSAFSKFDHELREVVADAIGVDRLDETRNRWHYNEDEREFVFTIHGVARLGVFKGLFEVTLTLNPFRPLEEQLLHLRNRVFAFQRCCEVSLNDDESRSSALDAMLLKARE